MYHQAQNSESLHPVHEVISVHCKDLRTNSKCFYVQRLTDGQTSGRKGKGELQTLRRACTSGLSMMASVCGL